MLLALPCLLPLTAAGLNDKTLGCFLFGVFFHFRAVLLLALVTSAPLRERKGERGRVIQTVLSSSPERKRERERQYGTMWFHI